MLQYYDNVCDNVCEPNFGVVVEVVGVQRFRKFFTLYVFQLWLNQPCWLLLGPGESS